MKPQGSPVVLILMIVACVPAFALGTAFGAGAVAIIGAFVALFSLIAFLGGPLRADVRLMGILAPALLVAGVGPRLLSEVSRSAAIAATVLIVFVGALLPLRGPRYAGVGQGVGMATLFSYASMATGPYGPAQLVAAVAAGLLVAMALRLLFGMGDPRKETRAAIASVLDADPPDIAGAFATWVSDGRPAWLGRALEGAARYRLGLQEASRQLRAGPDPEAAAAVEALTERAADVAQRLRSKPTKAGESDAVAEADASDTTAVGVSEHARPEAGERPAGPDDVRLPPPAARSAAAGLAEVESAMADRDDTAVALSEEQLATLRGARRPLLRTRSIHLRHALRTALGMLIMLVLTAWFGPGDPFAATVLLAAFSILQSSWEASLAKALPRLTGVLVGSAVALVVMLLAPTPLLLGLSLTALIVGLWFITDRPAIGNGCMVLVSVGLNVSSRHLDPVRSLLEYTGLMLAAVIVGLLVGFAVVPAWRPAPLRRRILTAWEATGAALAATASAADLETRVHATREAAAARSDLALDGDELDARLVAALDQYRAALSDLTLVGLKLRHQPDVLADLVHDVERGLTSPGGSLSASATELPTEPGAGQDQGGAAGEAPEPLSRALLLEARAAAGSLLDALPEAGANPSR